MRSIIIHEETNDDQNMVDVLRRIADLVEQGYTNGYEPSWELQGEEEPEEQDETEEDNVDEDEK